MLRSSAVAWNVQRIPLGNERAFLGIPMVESPPDLETVTSLIIGSALAVHRRLGPGLLESIYKDCLAVELKAAGLPIERERRMRLQYRGVPVGGGLRIDLLVRKCVVVEVKAVEALHPLHRAQVITYLKLAKCPAGLLLNFNVTSLRSGGLKRLTHPSLWSPGKENDGR